MPVLHTLVSLFKLDGLATVKSCCHHGFHFLIANVWPCIVFVDYLSGLITDDTSITAVSSYSVKTSVAKSSQAGEEGI